MQADSVFVDLIDARSLRNLQNSKTNQSRKLHLTNNENEHTTMKDSTNEDGYQNSALVEEFHPYNIPGNAIQEQGNYFL